MARKPRTNSVDERINRAYKLVGQGVQVSILDIPKVFIAGKSAIEAGQDDVQLQETIAALLKVIRKN